MRRVSAILLLLAALAMFPSSSAAEAAPATITFRVHNCPHGFVHQEFADVCNGALIGNASIALFSKATGRLKGIADNEGAIAFEIPEGTYTFEGPPGEFLADQYLTCTPGDPDRLNKSSFAVRSGETVICDLYLVGSSNCEPCPPTPTPLPSAGHIRDFHALVCDRDPGRVSSGQRDFPPSGCTAPGGITLTVTTGDGKPIGLCTTEVSGYCALHVIPNVVIITEDVSALPEGYAPQANPMLEETGSLPPVIVNVPVEALPTIAPADSTITVHSHVCSPGHSVVSDVSDCNNQLPDYPQMFFLQGQLGGADYLAKTIDADGSVTFSELLPEIYILVPGLPFDTVRGRVLCSYADAPGVIVFSDAMYAPGWSRTIINLGPHRDIVCDAYTIPPAA